MKLLRGFFQNTYRPFKQYIDSFFWIFSQGGDFTKISDKSETTLEICFPKNHKYYSGNQAPTKVRANLYLQKAERRFNQPGMKRVSADHHCSWTFTLDQLHTNKCPTRTKIDFKLIFAFSFCPIEIKKHLCNLFSIFRKSLVRTFLDFCTQR